MVYMFLSWNLGKKIFTQNDLDNVSLVSLSEKDHLFDIENVHIFIC